MTGCNTAGAVFENVATAVVTEVIVIDFAICVRAHIVLAAVSIALVVEVCINVLEERAVFFAANGTNRLSGAGCGAAGALFKNYTTAVVTYVIVIGVAVCVRAHVVLAAVSIALVVGVFVNVTENRTVLFTANDTLCSSGAGCSTAGAVFNSFSTAVITNVIVVFCAVCMSAEVLAATIVTCVILIGVYAVFEGCTAAIVTNVIVVGRAVCVSADTCLTSVIANMVLVGVFVFADSILTSIIAIVILVGVFMFADNYLTSIIAIVIFVGVFVFTEVLAATVVTVVICIGVYAIAEYLITTVVTVVICISVYAIAEDLITAVVAIVICISVYAIAEDLITTVVASVVLISIFTSAEDLIATVVAVVICISVYASAEDLITAVVAIVICISVYAIAEDFVATVVAVVICIGVYAIAEDFIATVVAVVILVSIFTSTECFVTSIVTCVILIGIYAVFEGCTAAVITNVVGVFVAICVSAHIGLATVSIALVVEVCINVTESSFAVLGVAVAARAGVGCVACCFTGGRGYNRFIAMLMGLGLIGINRIGACRICHGLGRGSPLGLGRSHIECCHRCSRFIFVSNVSEPNAYDKCVNKQD